MTKAEAEALLAAVQGNHAAIEKCAGHEFVALNDAPIFRKYRCSKCGGVVDSIAKSWYETGLKHGRQERAA